VDYPELIGRLDAMGEHRGMRLGLERVEAAADRIGRPADAFPAVHVAGTNGKGSTCHIVARILRAHRLRVGLTTSPHLHRFTERIRIDGDEIPPDELARAAERTIARLGGWDRLDLTYFEIVTLLAFERFAAHGVDIAVVETGLGGRLDATRLCRPAACAVTGIALDHTEILGNTLAEIAAEKAGILRPGVPLVLAPVPAEADAAIRNRAREIDAPVLPPEDAGAPPVPAGPRGRVNAAVAAACARIALERLGRTPDPARFALPPFTLPGRFQAFPGTPPLVLDVAHNPDGAACLVENLREARLRPRWVVGLLARKDWQGFLANLAPLGGHLHAAPPPSADARDPREIAAAWPGPSSVHPSPAAAIESARSAARLDETIVVTGSHRMGSDTII
jgi:dihydrofolate synthase/folylpolyglutamate synthase